LEVLEALGLVKTYYIINIDIHRRVIYRTLLKVRIKIHICHIGDLLCFIFYI
jgi:hypothetical protein